MIENIKFSQNREINMSRKFHVIRYTEYPIYKNLVILNCSEPLKTSLWTAQGGEGGGEGTPHV